MPYNVAMVELEEGPRIMTNIVDLPTGTLDEMPIGSPVEAVFLLVLGVGRRVPTI